MFEKESFYPSAALNCAITDTSVSFDPQLPLGNKAGTSLSPESDRLIPPGIMMLKGGKMRLNFMAPGAQSVTAEVHRKIYTLEKGDDGVWSTVADGGCGGFCPVVFRVDGAEVLNPMAPIGFGASRPINYADIPQPEGILLFGNDRNDEELPRLYASRLYERDFRRISGAVSAAWSR